ncbi:hypothetical protein LIER_03613 [Lithospermum erythrorhizon]|uniref:Pentatricopeptide repeat-containing protein n=1 Tax=Lithospermum erythrorhizon TaxID=34254 RepID=A0AAV3NTT4_LITER
MLRSTTTSSAAFKLRRLYSLPFSPTTTTITSAFKFRHLSSLPFSTTNKINQPPISISTTTTKINKPPFSSNPTTKVEQLPIFDNPTTTPSVVTLLTKALMFNQGPIKRTLSSDPLIEPLLGTLAPFEAESIILNLIKANKSETALVFFFWLRNELGFDHSLKCCLVIAHVLASKKRYRGLRCHLRHLVPLQGAIFIGI